MFEIRNSWLGSFGASVAFGALIVLGAVIPSPSGPWYAAETQEASTAESASTEETTLPLTRINQFTAKPGSGDDLYALIESFLPMIRQSDGCVEARLLRDVDDENRILVIEVWRDKDAHRASAANVPPGTFEKAMALMAGPPSGAYYQE